MTDRDHETKRDRKRQREVVFPIETLLEARSAGFSCRHIEADFEARARYVPLIKAPSHISVMGKHSK